MNHLLAYDVHSYCLVELTYPLPPSNMHGYTYSFTCKLESPMFLTKPSPQPKKMWPHANIVPIGPVDFQGWGEGDVW